MTRGLTLLECLVGITIGSILLAACCAVLLAAQRSAVSLAVSLEARGNAESAATVLLAELRGAARGELIRVSDSAVSLRALRGAGTLCEIDAARSRVTIDGALRAGLRAIDPLRDSLRILVERDPDDPDDDAWIQAGMTGAAGAACPAGGPGERVQLAGVPFSVLAAVGAGAPFRLVEIVEYRRYTSSGDQWFGVRSPSTSGWSASSPIAGPLDPLRGLRLAFRDAAGSPTAHADSVVLVEAEVQVLMRGRRDSSRASIGSP